MPLIATAAKAIRAAMAEATSSFKKKHPWVADKKGPPTLSSVADILSPRHSPEIKNVVLMVGRYALAEATQH